MKRSILLFLLLGLAGCSGNLLSPSGAPPRLYSLSAPAAAAAAAINASQVNWQLLIAMPDAPLNLNSARIALTPAPGRMDYYADVSWTDRVPAMLQDLLVESFDRSGKIGAVERQNAGLRADFILASDIQSFQVETGEPQPVAHISLTARLIRSRDRTIVASRTFDGTALTGSDFSGAISAFDTDLQKMLPDIVDWTLTQGIKNP
jgi:cholesterol transport system auxiliary component